MYNKHQNNMSVYYVQYSWIYMSVYYVLVDLYVSILCTRGSTCTINTKTICQYIMYSTRGFICQYIMYSWIYMYNKHQTICQYIMYSTRGFICQYIMYSWIYMYNKYQNNMSVYYVRYSWIYMYNRHQNNMSVYYVQYSWIYMSVYYVLVDLHVQ